MTKKRLLAITDSTGLPRPAIGLFYEDTYVYGLTKDTDAEFWVLSQGGIKIEDFAKRIAGLYGVFPADSFDLAVLQVGIVDCAPRPINEWMRKKIEYLHESRMKSMIISGLHRYRPFIQKHLWHFQNTPIKQFTMSFASSLNMLNVICKQVVIIPIAPVRDDIDFHSPGLRNEIEKYNAAIQSMSGKYPKTAVIGELYALLSQDNGKYLTTDAHLTKEAHQLMLSEIQKFLAKGKSQSAQ